MNGTVGQLALVAVLVAVNAAFAGSEMALVTLREGQLRRLEERSGAGRALARLAEEPNRFLSTIQIGITLAGFLASATAAVSLARPLEAPLSALGGAAPGVAIVLVTLVLSYITLVFGELAPKRIAMQRAEAWGLIVARPLSVIAALAAPAVWFLSRSTNAVVRLFGGDPERRREEVTPQELRDMVAANVTFTPQQRVIIDGAFEVSQRTLDEVLQPRPAVFVLDAQAATDVALADLVASGHSRAPVAPGANLDQIIGFVHMRDLLGEPAATVGDLVHEIPVFPETASVLLVLRELQRKHRQMGLVIDEHGGGAGIVTVEDLVEEIVGEIYDEADRDIADVRREPDGTMVMPGAFPVHDLVDLGVEGDRLGESATVAGLMLERLGRIPDRPGDEIQLGPWTFTVVATRGRRITEVRIAPRATPDPNDER